MFQSQHFFACLANNDHILRVLILGTIKLQRILYDSCPNGNRTGSKWRVRRPIKSINCRLSSDVLPPKKKFALQLSSIANFQITRTRKYRKAPRVLSFFYFIKIINYVHMHDKVNTKNRQMYTIKIVQVPNAFMKRYHENISHLLFQKMSFFPKFVSFFFLFFFFDRRLRGVYIPNLWSNQSCMVRASLVH